MTYLAIDHKFSFSRFRSTYLYQERISHPLYFYYFFSFQNFLPHPENENDPLTERKIY